MASGTRLLHIFWDTDFRKGHDGLTEVCAEEKITVAKLRPGEMVCFVNPKRTMLKVMAGTGEEDGKGVVGFYKPPHGRINEHSLQFIAEAFQGGKINYNQALRKGLLKQLGMKEDE